MTTPDERTRAVLHAEEFLMYVAFADWEESDIRDMAKVILRHFPSPYHMGKAVENEKNDPLGLKVWGECPELNDRILLGERITVRLKSLHRPDICRTDSTELGKRRKTRVQKGSKGVEAKDGAEN